MKRELETFVKDTHNPDLLISISIWATFDYQSLISSFHLFFPYTIPVLDIEKRLITKSTKKFPLQTKYPFKLYFCNFNWPLILRGPYPIHNGFQKCAKYRHFSHNFRCFCGKYIKNNWFSKRKWWISHELQIKKSLLIFHD